MTKRYVLLLCCTVLLLGSFIGYSSTAAGAAFGKATLKRGATGGDVYELQGRLKYLGFFTGKVDGKFWVRTERAVRLYQYENRLKVDGVVGPKTKQKLVSQTKAWAPGVENRIYKQGDRGGYIWEMQRRLGFLGFYQGKIDGKFGSKTDRAIRWFQSAYGIKSDGKVGADTKLKLWQASKNWSPTNKVRKGAPPKVKIAVKRPVKSTGGGTSKGDVYLLARAIHGEARGEPYVGKVAVAAVILNRIRSNQFPDSIPSIIYEPRAFTAVDDGQINLHPDAESLKAANDALNGWDPTSGSLYYFNPDTATSGWIWTRPQTKKIGKHIFAR